MIEFAEGVIVGAIIANVVWVIMVALVMRTKTFKVRE